MSTLLAYSLIEYLTKPNIILAILLAAFGVGFALLAKRVAKAIRHTNEVKEDDLIMVSFKIVGLLLILVALILMIIKF